MSSEDKRLLEEEKFMQEQRRDAVEFELNKYQVALREEQRVQRRIDILVETQTSLSFKQDGMPRSTKQQDYSDYLVKKEDFEEELQALREERKTAYNYVKDLIKLASNETQKDVLDLRYLAGLSFSQIATKLHYEDSNIKYHHNKALDQLSLILTTTDFQFAV